MSLSTPAAAALPRTQRLCRLPSSARRTASVVPTRLHPSRSPQTRIQRTSRTSAYTYTMTNPIGCSPPPSILRQRQEDARLIRCDAEQQRRNELGKGYDRLRSVLNRGDERLSKYRVVERATARVVQLRDQNDRMEDELRRKQELIRDLNRLASSTSPLPCALAHRPCRANEQLMLEASGAAPLLVSSPQASSPSSGRPGSSSHTSVSAFGVGQPGHAHDRSSSLPTPPHTYTGLQHPPDPTGEFGHPSYSKADTFAYNPGTLEADPHLYPPEFYAAAPHGLGIPRSESPGHLHHFLSPDDQAHWSNDWNATGSGLPGTFTDITSTSAGFTTSSSAYVPANKPAGGGDLQSYILLVRVRQSTRDVLSARWNRREVEQGGWGAGNDSRTSYRSRPGHLAGAGPREKSLQNYLLCSLFPPRAMGIIQPRLSSGGDYNWVQPNVPSVRRSDEQERMAGVSEKESDPIPVNELFRTRFGLVRDTVKTLGLITVISSRYA
ncbi:phlebovirus nonstructural domain-containing protein [Rhizoctonia solani AG-1 IA]|uniref:Phlebovirus nonstructural domain-containing protein n=1 Tax=Thanatephorus cucumeris (strain AG1-IA) TaxID=983506 RepID=L8WU77_THACA|nr:phlebovirus nonstructural domain-containing protein [Rhizoctonia solani AG-1 IA]